MRHIIAVTWLIACALPACALNESFRDRQQARQVCVEQARASGHRVTGVRSVEQQGSEQLMVLLDVEGGAKPILICDYDERAGKVALLRW
jgi:hypothetical protein